MSNPFPGMNLNLEQSEYWSDFHNQLVAEIDLLTSQSTFLRYNTSRIADR
ncbi:MAG TPA: DUF4058 family protein [Oscillatoriales cyanobacterium M59_W2019_021]|nr:MAG: DUF4058 family protein [Cyanobacteria bacterium J055]HIK33362.1 DUF4058 family protein [Oscillatoriales cyanobacterium M4454_W2019_049]HIK52390.1 DUF4058 family protein [Oscillatoriales cyanobacterium M59_W2019_021]